MTSCRNRCSVQHADLQPQVLDDLLRDRGQPFADLRQHVDVAPEGIQVLRLAETVSLDEPRVVRRVVGHHERRRQVEPVDQQPELVVQRRIGRPAKAEDVPLGEPPPRRVEQAVGRLLVVGALEEPEEPPPLSEALDVPAVQDRRDPPADLARPVGQKRLDLVPLVERMGAISHQFLLAAAQRGDPVRVVAVQRPRKRQECLLLASGHNGYNGQIGHKTTPEGCLSRAIWAL